MMNRQLRNAFFICVFVALSLNFAMADDPNFELGGKAGNATAIVTEKQFKLNVTVDTVDDYKKGVKTFNLSIGGCTVKTSIYQNPITPSTVVVSLAVNGKTQGAVNGLSLIIVQPEVIKFWGSDIRPSSVEGCNVKFGDPRDGKYYVPVELSGDVPEGFKLSSTDVKMVNPTEPTEPASNKPDDGIGSAAIVGIIVGAVALCLVPSLIGGFIFYRYRKNKALQEDLHRRRRVITKSAETLVAKAPDVKTAEQKTEDSKVPAQEAEDSKVPAKKNKSAEPKKKSAEPKPIDDKDKKQGILN